MTLPIRTTVEDIQSVCGYLATKPTGATLAQAKTVLDSKRLDRRKLNALKQWKLITEEDEKLKTTPLGREVAKDGASLKEALVQVIRDIPPYLAIIERASHKGEDNISSLDVAAHWNDHFKDESGDSDRLANDQAVTFFNVAEGAGLGKKVAGRRGNVTRFDFFKTALKNFSTLGHSQIKQSHLKSRSTPHVPATTSNEDTTPSYIPQSTPSTQQYLHKGLIVDCYKLQNRIGSGFSAEVWTAKVQKIPPSVEVEKGQQVAIKFYTSSALEIADQVIRVEREYRVAQRLRHPNLIRIYEFMLCSPRPFHNFLVMDVAQGPTLSHAISAHSFDISSKLKIIAQVFAGAHALHSAGALHRDIKPGNISVEIENGEPVRAILLDLGIVSPMFEKGLTAVSRFVGSKHWAPLEQLIGHKLDVRSDIYSIGAVAYNLLMGVEPFSTSGTEAAVAVEMQKGGLQIPALSGIPTEIIDMFNACLSIKAEDRPNDTEECLELLEGFGVRP